MTSKIFQKFWNNTPSGYVSGFVYTIYSEFLADSKDSDELCYKAAHSSVKNNTFIDDNCKKLYDKLTGELIDDNQFVRKSTIKNGSKLILY